MPAAKPLEPANITSAEPDTKRVDVLRDFQMPEQGATTQVWAAVSPDLAGIGSVYLADRRIREDVAPYAIDQAHAVGLWELSERLCGAEVRS